MHFTTLYLAQSHIRQIIFNFDQDDAKETGPCWDPNSSENDEQQFDVCEMGCYQKFNQVIRTYPNGEDDTYDEVNTDIARSCKGSFCNIF